MPAWTMCFYVCKYEYMKICKYVYKYINICMHLIYKEFKEMKIEDATVSCTHHVKLKAITLSCHVDKSSHSGICICMRQCISKLMDIPTNHVCLFQGSPVQNEPIWWSPSRWETILTSRHWDWSKLSTLSLAAWLSMLASRSQYRQGKPGAPSW